jgi:hypothetical protein
MVTYYLDASNPQRLRRQTGTGAAQPVALGINVLQFAYDYLNAGGTISVNQRGACCPLTGLIPKGIRKVNIWTIAKADHRSRKSKKFYSNSIATSVTVQNLAYFNKY